MQQKYYDVVESRISSHVLSVSISVARVHGPIHSQKNVSFLLEVF